MPKSKAAKLHWLRSVRSILTLLTCCLAMQGGAYAATFTVSTNANTGAGSLRDAITAANGAAGADTIVFAIGSGTQTITLNSALPPITGPLTINGTTQAGFAGKPIIVLKPANNVFGIAGIEINATNCLIKGLVLNGFGSSGIEISGPNTANNSVQGCYIGVDVTGNVAAPNGEGINITGGASSNTIGGTTAAARNVISANNGQGIRITSAGTNFNVVSGNFIGTNAAGTADMGNSISGILIDQANGTVVGGSAAGAGNVISGNGNSGVHINDPNTEGNVVQGNYIGTNAAGNAAIGNTNYGVQVSASAKNNSIGGLFAGMRNVISGNGIGVWIQGTGTENIAVQGNYIGTNAGGTGPVPNLTDGVRLEGSTNSNTIGGTTAAARNVISGNGADGIVITGEETRFNVVRGNYIGTNYTGNNALPNGDNGVHISGSAYSNSIGNGTAGGRNLISANGQNGILIEGLATQFNVVMGNYIGTNAAGTGALGNTRSGVEVASGATTNSIGSGNAGDVNRIAYNKHNGITVSGGVEPGTKTVIRGNEIFSNVKLGIDLGDDGVTLNDDDDPDTGANDLQNFPVITGASQAGGNTTVTGTLNSTPSTNFTVDIFRSSAPDPTGYGEGQVYVGSVGVTTNAAGDLVVPINFTFPGNFAGQFFSATATPDAGNTSEFGRSSFTLSGRITTTASVAIPGVTVTRNGGFTVTTNGAGYYTFFNVPVGVYNVVPSSPNYIFSPLSRSVTISTANVSGQNFIGYTSGPYSINGRISLSNGTGLVGITVTLPGRPSVVTNGAGYFMFPNVPNGTYTFTPSGGGYTYTPSSRTVTINGANANNQNFIGANGFTVHGRVQTSNGVGIPDVSIQLNNGPAIFTNGAGYYSFPNVPNGTYTISPFKLGWTFTPPSKQITVNGANVVNQNFIGAGQ